MDKFRYLPGLSRYGITEDGRIFDHLRVRWTGSRSTEDYVWLHLRNDKGKIINTSRHRMVASAFHGDPPVKKAIVNHKNGIKGDDKAENLEWTTYQGNQWHAGELGLTTKCIPVSVRDPKTKTITNYPSALAAGEAVGLSKDAILWRLSKGEERIYPEGLQYRRRVDDRPWAEEVIADYGSKKSVVVKNIETDEVISFDTQTLAASFIGVGLSVLSQTLAEGPKQRLLSGKFLVKRNHDATPWRIVKDALKESNNQPIVVIHEETGVEKIYPTARACAADMGLLTTTLNERLKHDGQKIFKGYRFRRY